MLILVHGNNFSKVKKKTEAVVASLHKKRPHAEIFHFDDESLTSDTVRESVGTNGLFERKLIVVCKDVLASTSAREHILSFKKELKESDNVFILSEKGTVPSTVLKKLDKYIHTVYEVKDLKKTAQQFSTFSLSDALGRRDTKNLWTLYQQACREGVPSEEINGILFWQIKSMILAKNSKNAKEAGLKPFVFSKSKKYSDNFSIPELQKISSQMIVNYHESRRGRGDFQIKLEKLILSL